MHLSLSALVALSSLSFLDFAAPVLAGHSRLHRHHAASHASSILKRGAAPGLVEIPIGDLQLLRMEMTAFQEWMHSWISTANASDPATNLAQLKLEFQAYDGWMTAWLDSTLSPSPPPPLPSSIPVTASTTSSTTTASSSASVIVASPRVPQADASTSSEADPTTSIRAGEFFQQPSSSRSAAATTLIPIFQASSSLSVVSIQLPSSSAPVTSVVPASSAPAVAEPTTEPAVPATSPPSEDSSTFNAQSSSNLAVYYGQSPATSQTTLAQMCQDPHVDIVILAFLTTFFGPGGYPSLNLGAACAGPSPEMRSAGASGLLRCPALESDIQTCQTLGKKVLLSLGGAEATTAFSSDAQASAFATQLWDLFGAGGGGQGGDQDMRPFGRAVLDGFDVDNEDHSTAFYSTFVSALRAAMDAGSQGGQGGRRYYISAAPQCPRPDASIPLDAMRTMDFVFVQFYNNGDCNVGQPGFEASLTAWSRDLQSATGDGPKLYIGAPGCSACAGSGYLGAGQMAGVLQKAKAAGLSNLGGVMLWDGSEGMANREAAGKSYLSAVKGAMA
ncbi:MAG: hypothetical protein Q9173_006049 [Seirophora scorigena]